jgi:NADH-quinone oxidoreductase subunit H
VRRAIALGLGWLALSCAPRQGALLVELGEITPRTVEVGDRLRITGSGFPEGRPATVVLRGDASRAGEPVAHGIEVRTPARLVSPHALEVQVTPELAAAICDRADPRHTTLRADLEVQFASQRGPRTTVNGRLEGVTLDVTPELRSETGTALLRQEGLRFARFLGMEVARSEEGLTVLQVAEQSRASRAGLAAGDVVLELDGLLVHGLSDFVPPPNLRSSRLSLRRGLEPLTLSVDSAGFRYTSPASLSNAVALVMAVAFALILLASPFGRLLGLLERRVVERLREDRQTGREPRPSLHRILLRALARELPPSLGRYLALVSVTAAWVLIAFGQSLVATEIDLPLLPLFTVTGLVALAIGLGGTDKVSLVSGLLSGFGRAFAILVHQIPLAVTLLLALLQTGSFRATDVVRTQGAWPWQWNSFSSPALALASLLALVSQVPLVRPVAAFAPARTLSWRERALDVSQWAHDLVVSGLLALTVFGGWAAGSGGTATGGAMGAALLLGKAWVLLLGIVFLRWTLGPADVARVARLTAVWFAGPSLGLLAVAVALRRWSGGAVAAAFDQRGAWALSAAVLLGLAWIVLRVVRQARHPGTELRVLPWL